MPSIMLGKPKSAEAVKKDPKEAMGMNHPMVLLIAPFHGNIKPIQRADINNIDPTPRSPANIFSKNFGGCVSAHFPPKRYPIAKLIKTTPITLVLIKSAVP